jgi:hypothetical protein
MPQSEASPPSRPFTIKALAFGGCAAVAITVLAALNNIVRDGQTPVIGHYLPPVPFMLVIVMAAVWNPLAGRWARLRFSHGELAVVLGLILCCSWIPHTGFGRYFMRTLVLPAAQADAHPEWRANDTTGHLPVHTLPMSGSPEHGPLRTAIARARGSAPPDPAISAADWSAALDLAQLVPPRELFRDPILARRGAALALARAQAVDGVERWSGAAALLESMPRSLAPDEPPAAWAQATAHLKDAMAGDLAAAEREYERVYPGLLNGLPTGDETVGLEALPWRTWLPVLALWLPLVAVAAVCWLALSLVVHRQWAHHEQLRYPIAGLATAVISRGPGQLLGELFRSRLFWWGLVPVAGIHALNGLAFMFPGDLPSVPLHWRNDGVLYQVFPDIGRAGGMLGLSWGDIYFAVIGLAYFIAAEISLSVGISGLVMVLLCTQWYAATGTTADVASLRAGAFIGFAAVLAWTGRAYYAAVFAAALGRAAGSVLPEQVWAARIFLLGFAALLALLIGPFGIDWPVALAFSMLVLIAMLVVSRIVCETGIPLVQAAWSPAQVVASALGFAAVGPAPLVAMQLIGAAVFHDTREALLPFASTAAKVAEDAGVPRLRFAVAALVVMAVALVAGVAASAWGLYNFGGGRDGYGFWVGADALTDATRGISEMVETGAYATAAATDGLGKIALIAPNDQQQGEMGWITAGILLVATLGFMRLRFAWWPLHPAMLVLMGTWLSARVWLSFLIGWLAMTAIVRFGGARSYHALKPLFIGMVVGELGMAFVSIALPWGWYLVTGLELQYPMLFPG